MTTNYRLEINYLRGTDVAMNVLHYQTADDSSTPDDLVTNFDSNISALITPLIANAAYLESYRAIHLGTLEEASNLVHTAGTGGAEGLPPQVAGLIAFKTRFANRSKRGRIYIPYGTESQQTAGVWSAAYLSDLSDLGDALLSIPSTGQPYTLVIYSRKYLTFTAVEFAEAQVRTATQRRRNWGVGV